MKTLLCALAMLLGTSSVWAMTLPTLPTPFAQQTRPTITGSTFTVTTCANFKTALDSAAAASLSLNHVINVQAGLNCTLMYLPPHSGVNGGWIIVRSANFASLPPAGTRVTTADAANMPVITYGAKTNPYTGCGDEAALAASTNAQNYWIEGFDFEANTACPGCITPNKNYSLILTGYANCNYTNTKNLVFSHVIMRDQDANHVLARGILCDMDKGGLALLDSYAVGIKTPPDSEAQALGCSNNPGPTLIQNNFLQAATEVIIFGGAGALDATHVPQDITVRLNDISHDLAMRNPTNPWSLKTLLELKMGVRVLIEANTFKYAWTGVNGDDGHAFRFTVRSWGACATCFYFSGNQFGDPTKPLCNTLPICPQSVAAVSDVTFRYNDTRHMGSAWSMFSSDDGNGGNSQGIARWYFHDNLFADFTYDATCLGGCGSMFDWANGGPYPALDILFEHNTFYNDGTVDSRIMNAGSAPIGQVSGGPTGSNPPVKTADMDFIFRNNIIQFGTYGIVGNTVNGPGAFDSSFTTGALPNGYQWTNNVISGFAASGAVMSTYVQGTRFVNNCYSTNGAKDGAGNAAMTVAQIGFDNPGNGDSNTFVLTNPAFKAGGACQATDGTDQGVNWTLYNAARGVAVVASCTGASPTWTATPDYASVNSCVSQAQSGDTVNVVAGSATWTTQLVIPSRPMTIQGAGGTNTQITDGTSSGGATSSSGLFRWTTSSTPGIHRITGFYLDANFPIPSGNEYNLFTIDGNTTQLRIDHNVIHTRAATGFYTDGYLRGVIDHNTIVLYDNRYLGKFYHTGWNNSNNCAPVSVTCGDTSWAAPDSMGGADNIFIEDNTVTCTFVAGIVCTTAFDGHGGTRIVARFNSISDVTHGNMHGTESATRGRGFRHAEWYRERLIVTDCATPWGAGTRDCINGTGFRGATGRAFDLQFISQTGTGFGFHEGLLLTASTLRHGCGSGVSDCSWPWGSCGINTIASGNLTSTGSTARVTYPNHFLTFAGGGRGSYVTISGASPSTYNGTFQVTATDAGSTAWFEYNCGTTCGSTATGGFITYRSPWDQNSGATGYRCLDQAGAGKSDLLPSIISTANATWPNQLLDPIYTWNITLPPAYGHAGNLVGVANDPSDIIVKNRDVYDDVSASCAPGAGTCASGVGRGLRTQRPLACVSGTAWWHTNTTTNWNTSTTDAAYNPSGVAGEDGGLDICGTSGWVNDSYVPYAYPHPLQGGAVSSAPAPPTGLQVQ